MKVYFNNSCKICKAEIDLYKKEKIQEIDWVDITNNTLAENETSKNSKELLHLIIANFPTCSNLFSALSEKSGAT